MSRVWIPNPNPRYYVGISTQAVSRKCTRKNMSFSTAERRRWRWWWWCCCCCCSAGSGGSGCGGCQQRAVQWLVRSFWVIVEGCARALNFSKLAGVRERGTHFLECSDFCENTREQNLRNWVPQRWEPKKSKRPCNFLQIEKMSARTVLVRQSQWPQRSSRENIFLMFCNNYTILSMVSKITCFS